MVLIGAVSSDGLLTSSLPSMSYSTPSSFFSNSLLASRSEKHGIFVYLVTVYLTDSSYISVLQLSTLQAISLLLSYPSLSSGVSRWTTGRNWASVLSFFWVDCKSCVLCPSRSSREKGFQERALTCNTEPAPCQHSASITQCFSTMR